MAIAHSKSRKNTLCWCCARYAGGCSWSRDFVPVIGWLAKPTKIKYGAGEKTIITDSFHIAYCPEFKRDVEDKDDG